MISYEYMAELAKQHAEWHYLYIDIEQPITAEQGKKLHLKQIADGLFFHQNIGFFAVGADGKLRKIKGLER